MFAKRFFFVCAGLLCLALAYHFGATSATAAKPGSSYQCFAVGANGVYGVKDRFLYQLQPSGPPYRYQAPLPGTATPIVCGTDNAGNPAVILGNDEVWRWNGSGDWVFAGSFAQ